MLGTYFRDRHNIVLTQWQTASLYTAAIAPEFLVNGVRQHGGSTPAGALLSFLNSNTGSPGSIYFTTDGSDPRLVGGAVNTASAQQFSSPVNLTAATHVKARILRNGLWSALTEATFVAPIADFDGNNVVNGRDFLAWQRGFGISGAATLEDGDANGDGDVDGDDLAAWQAQYGTTVSSINAFAVASISANTESEIASGDSDLLNLPSGSALLALLPITSFNGDLLDRPAASKHIALEQSNVTQVFEQSLLDDQYGQYSELQLAPPESRSRSQTAVSASDQVFEQWDVTSFDPLANDFLLVKTVFPI
jgi:hypothetical protein